MKKFAKTFILLILAVIMSLNFACVKRPDDPPEKEAEFSIDETIQKLSESAYANQNLSDDGFYGLSDITEVGVKQANVNDEMYPIDKTGLTVINYSTFSSASDDYEKLLEALNYAKNLNLQGKKALIEFPANGKLTINSSLSDLTNNTYNLEGYNGLYIAGNNCTVELTYDDFSFKGFMLLNNCKDVHFNDFTIDYAIPTAVNGEITAIDKSDYTITVAIDSRFNETMERVAVNGGILQSYVEFSRATKVPLENGNFCTASENFITGYTLSGNSAEGYFVKVKFGSAYYGSFSDVALGGYANLAFSMYGYNAFYYNGCENVYMENVGVATCPGMGVVGVRSENIYINRLKIAVPENSGRLMTTTADGLHFGECFGEVKITNSLIEYCHDDALNIKSGYWYNLTSVNIGEKEVVISRKTSGIMQPKTGDIIEFYDAGTLEKKGDGAVVSVSGNESAYRIKLNKSLMQQNAGDWNNCVATNVSRTAKLKFSNNIVRNKRNRGLLVQVREAEISNNAFFNVGHGSISIHTSLDVFNEATIPDNVIVKNNKFINNNYLLSLAGDISVFAKAEQLGPIGTIKNIVVENNFISRNGNAGISLYSCSDSSVKDNLIHNSGRITSGEIYECSINLTNAGNINVARNYAYRTLESESYAGIITGGLTSTDSIVLSDNKNLNYQKAEVVSATTEVQKLVREIVIDGNLSDWEGQGTDVFMVGHSLATGQEIDPSEYADGFGVKMCKIGWTDSGIYIAFAVKDNEHLFKTINNFWNGDCVELFFSTVLDMPNADMQLYRNSGDVAQIAFVPTWTKGWGIAGVRTSDNIIANENNIVAVSKLTDDGYAGEMFMPFSVFAAAEQSIKSNEEIAIAFVFADGDRDKIGRKRVQVSNVPHFVEAWKTKTAKMPLFKFVG